MHHPCIEPDCLLVHLVAVVCKAVHVYHAHTSNGSNSVRYCRPFFAESLYVKELLVQRFVAFEGNVKREGRPGFTVAEISP